jgi:hypothetical protein
VLLVEPVLGVEVELPVDPVDGVVLGVVVVELPLPGVAVPPVCACAVGNASDPVARATARMRVNMALSPDGCL